MAGQCKTMCLDNPFRCSFKNATMTFVYLRASNVEINDVDFYRISDRLSPIYMIEKEATDFFQLIFVYL
jgi:hypothetical protein